ncbi:MAG: HD domain-containing protein [Thermoanaerobaculia bacterium]
MRRNETLLELLLELQVLDRVPRMGYVLRGVPHPESITEHSWHVAFLVWALGSRIPGVDLLRALEIALVHDLAEVRTGDLPRVAKRYFARGTQEAAEREVIDELLGPLGDRTAELMAEYRAAETAEARLVKACDKLQLMVKVAAYERWGAGWLAEFWDNPDNFPDLGFDAVRELFEELARTHGGRDGPPAPRAGADPDADPNEPPE